MRTRPIAPSGYRGGWWRSHPRSVAMILLLGCFPSIVKSDDTLDQESILLKFFDMTNGLKWRNRTNWLSDTEGVCEWYGVICYDEEEVDADPSLQGMIKSLQLRNNKLSGIPPSELFQLPNLLDIDFKDNPDMDFSFSGIEKATQLQELALSATGLTSLDGLGMTSKTLRLLHLTDLGLSGPIPEEIYEMTNLRKLYCNYNSFTGTLSSKVGNLANLQELFIFDNELNGQIPDEIGNLSKLTMLALSENSFEGILPKTLNNLVNLEVLAIQHQKSKGGSGIGGNLLDFSNLSALGELYLSGNSITGNIPDTFLEGITNNEDIIKVDLSKNKLTGTVPSSLSRFERMKLYLAKNQIEAIAPELCQKRDWMGGDVGNFNCDAILCPSGYFQTGGRQSSEDSPCEQCPPGSVAKYLGSTKCALITPQELNQREILEKFYHATDGRFWKNQEFWLGETVDVCGWYGITCTSGMIQEISLEANELSGTPPADIFKLTALETLDLSRNFIEFSFEGIGNATKLTNLVLSQTGLSSIASLGQAKSLVSLNLESNFIKENMENELFDLVNLKHLYLSHNPFSGNLHSNIGNLVNLQGLHCYGCRLSGQIPTTIGKLTQLAHLDLAENDFTGGLPTELNQLTKLTFLSLHQTTKSGSGISGPLLDFANLSVLTELYLDSNSLTGTIPPTLLAKSAGTEEKITIGLSSNFLEGQVPTQLERFKKLNIDLADNRITDIADKLCGMTGWMDGWVATFGCDAILCETGTYSEFGRRTSENFECKPCQGTGLAPFYGSTQCQLDTSQGQQLTSRDILEKLFFLTGGHNWESKDNWLNEFVSICEWHGITCYNQAGMENEVKYITLGSNGLSGTPPSEIFQLPNLKVLDLKRNSISFSFDGIEKATKLHNLTLSETGLTSVAGIGKATSLRALHLTQNGLSGTIPDEIFDLVNLQELYLNFNKLSGRLSSKIGNLVNLNELFLFHNNFSGQIPASIGTLTNLKLLTLAKNKFSGTLPEELNELTNVEIISLEGNENSTEGISGPLLDFANLSKLQQLYLNFNSLTGTIPSTFLSGIEDKFNEVKVDLISNQLEGSVPSELVAFQKLRLYIAENKIENIPNEICLKEEWMNGEVQNYKCNAIACPPNTFNEFGRQSDADRPCQACEGNMIAPFYGSLKCISGATHASMQERDILEDFYHATDGPNWNINANWLEPEISICKWHGITCVADDIESVEAIHLSKNSLSNQPPTDLFLLTNLQELNLADNPITFSFHGIEYAEKLSYLNLESTGLTSLSGVEKATAITLLNVKKNEFDGSIPEEIFSLSNLEVLYLSDNSFSGELPEDMRNLSNLRFISAYNCGLSGYIPEWIGDISNLEFLRLDQNSLSGILPNSLGSLELMEHLDLSDQTSKGGAGITGPLIDFSRLGNINELLLHSNSLTGTISSNLLLNADASSVITVDLRSNNLIGTIPTDLSRFQRLVLLLAGNKIESVPTELCASDSLWMYGDVASFQCDGIMCPPDTFNEDGRQTEMDRPCQPCQQKGAAPYFGSTECIATDAGSPSTPQNSTQKAILEHLFKKTGGNIWKDSTNWLSDISICQWHGIACYDEEGKQDQVKTINLSYNRLHGTPPHELFQLPHLQELDLKGNPISFSFIGIQNAYELEKLVLSETGLTSIVGISKAPALRSLHLTDNELEGSIPDEIFNLVNLEELYLNFNKLSGKLSPNIGDLVSLKELFLFQNLFSGQIPSSIGKLTNLKVLALAHNHFTGTLPEEMNDLVNIEILSIQREGNLEGEEDSSPLQNDRIKAGITGPILDFSKLQNLHELYLGSNRFTGTIPSSFLGGISDHSQKVKVDLTMNKLRGTIPSELSTFEDMKLYIAGNHIKGISDALCKKNTWMNGEVQSFSCDAIACPPNTFNEYGRQSTSDTPCEPCPGSTKAQFYGSLECVEGTTQELDEKAILTMFYHATNGDDWIDNYNWLDDTKSICDWNGITCASGDDGVIERVIKIELGSNNLYGTPPDEIFQLPSLQVFDLHDNNIDFHFDGIGSATKLTELNLDSTNLNSLVGIGNAPRTLSVLRLQNNDFGSSRIRDEFFNLVGLKHLYLSGSNFSGKLPRLIGNLVKLEEFYCSENYLFGQIPASIGNLSRLRVLVLSENDLSGTLPRELNQLPKLESLYLDSYTRGDITGSLPDFSNLPYLTELFLGFNELTGSIPSTFLSGVLDPMQSMRIGLNSNKLSGKIPKELSQFKRMDIDLAGNKIRGIAPELCKMGEWMQGMVGKYGCDAILCPPGTFSLHGRQSTSQASCKPCEKTPSPYYGSNECGSDQKEKEKQILAKLYHTCGGENWKQNEKWLDEKTDYCDWYGITCTEGQTVESLLLGSNNIVGTPPPELFELRDLRYLWLYSNPVDFKFDHIENAIKLTSILLDSTGIKSIEGIGRATNLEEIDLRFNQLSGSIPEEIFELTKLESLSLSDNKLSGQLLMSSFSQLTNLKKLRLGSNYLTGSLPDFATLSELKSLDVSSNSLTGTIPSTLLENTDPSQDVFIDLSSNDITGIVPKELARFDKLTLYIRENQIEQIDPVLCSKDAWNDGDVGDFGCDGILCSQGTYSSIGRQSKRETPCEECELSNYYGSTTCASTASASVSSAAGVIQPGVLGLGLVVVMIGWLLR